MNVQLHLLLQNIETTWIGTVVAHYNGNIAAWMPIMNPLNDPDNQPITVQDAIADPSQRLLLVDAQQAMMGRAINHILGIYPLDDGQEITILVDNAHHLLHAQVILERMLIEAVGMDIRLYEDVHMDYYYQFRQLILDAHFPAMMNRFLTEFVFLEHRHANEMHLQIFAHHLISADVNYYQMWRDRYLLYLRRRTLGKIRTWEQGSHEGFMLQMRNYWRIERRRGMSYGVGSLFGTSWEIGAVMADPILHHIDIHMPGPNDPDYYPDLFALLTNGDYPLLQLFIDLHLYIIRTSPYLEDFLTRISNEQYWPAEQEAFWHLTRNVHRFQSFLHLRNNATVDPDRAILLRRIIKNIIDGSRKAIKNIYPTAPDDNDGFADFLAKEFVLGEGFGNNQNDLRREMLPSYTQIIGTQATFVEHTAEAIERECVIKLRDPNPLLLMRIQKMATQNFPQVSRVISMLNMPFEKSPFPGYEVHRYPRGHDPPLRVSHRFPNDGVLKKRNGPHYLRIPNGVEHREPKLIANTPYHFSAHPPAEIEKGKVGTLAEEWSSVSIQTDVFSVDQEKQIEIVMALDQYCLLDLFQIVDEMTYDVLVEKITPPEMSTQFQETQVAMVQELIRSFMREQPIILRFTANRGRPKNEDEIFEGDEIIALNDSYRVSAGADELLVDPPIFSRSSARGEFELDAASRLRILARTIDDILKARNHAGHTRTAKAQVRETMEEDFRDQESRGRRRMRNVTDKEFEDAVQELVTNGYIASINEGDSIILEFIKL